MAVTMVSSGTSEIFEAVEFEGVHPEELFAESALGAPAVVEVVAAVVLVVEVVAAVVLVDDVGAGVRVVLVCEFSAGTLCAVVEDGLVEKWWYTISPTTASAITAIAAFLSIDFGFPFKVAFCRRDSGISGHYRREEAFSAR
jgi:hypothetical protein